MDVYLSLVSDTHGDFRRVKDFCIKNKTKKDDTVIIVGDCGINYFLNNRDKQTKEYITQLPITLFCIRGNHEMRPEHIENKHYELYFGNRAIVEDEYPNIKYALDGFDYTINGHHALVIGGAYSVDKDHRLEKGWSWFEDEQLSKEEQKEILDYAKWLDVNDKIEIILSHTCPITWEPTDLFIGCVDQSKVDKSMELFLGEIEFSIDYDYFYFGHYHADRDINSKATILYQEIIPFGLDLLTYRTKNSPFNGSVETNV